MQQNPSDTDTGGNLQQDSVPGRHGRHVNLTEQDTFYQHKTLFLSMDDNFLINCYSSKIHHALTN